MITPVHVAVGVILNSQGQVLLSIRHAHSHQGGLWEFPGGKVESGESVKAALKRELSEELGISISTYHPLTKIQHHYKDKSVLLDVWVVNGFRGEAQGKEGQHIQWCNIDALLSKDFPAANLHIIKLLQLPDRLAITPTLNSLDDLLELLQHYTVQGITMVQLRQWQLDSAEYLHWATQAKSFCQANNLQLLINRPIDDFAKHAAGAGYHASSRQLASLMQRPVDTQTLFSASCHSLDELQQAENLGADFALLSNINPSDSHPDRAGMGWEGFKQLAQQVSIPVYGLGGLNEQDLSRAKQMGAHGIAAISAFLRSS
ncbi:MAG: hypothetical protein COC19_07140 [SAR86 cluster bacterium]|uniref:8-oxo-dGTP diphosphatase n=1 Tax=SAR86 cluster bacterium TaxID=2030880 RepID=A0A2A4MGX4_9GAMM|nr:MAG: hypothetical protein COC19_07140 [SAR86 cluster bacterium]